mmetsp:Transcript_18295/g.38221  ORF Transcript_18295/g.38221 Transcript_18295/m.38221 type:complete len:222 (+) Transcript_18295:1105-1770(+)
MKIDLQNRLEFLLAISPVTCRTTSRTTSCLSWDGETRDSGRRRREIRPPKIDAGISGAIFRRPFHTSRAFSNSLWSGCSIGGGRKPLDRSEMREATSSCMASSISTNSLISTSWRKAPFPDRKNFRRGSTVSGLKPPGLDDAPQEPGAALLAAMRLLSRFHRSLLTRWSTSTSDNARRSSGDSSSRNLRDTYGYAESTILKFGSTLSAIPSRIVNERITSE